MCNALGQRFRDVIRYLRDRELVYNEAQLASKLGIGRSFLSDMKNGRKEITEQTVLKLCELFPFISHEWLLSGIGNMIVENVEYKQMGVPAQNVVSIPTEAWEVIRMQAASLERKDAQIDRVIDLLERQLSNDKKNSVKEESGARAEIV